MKFNLNDYIKVKLNDKGRYILRQRHDALMEMISENNGQGFPFRPPEVDEEGYSRFQAWSFMKTFSPFLGLGSDLPFDMNIIIEE